VIVIGLGVCGLLLLPRLVPPVPAANSPTPLALLAGGLALLAVISLRRSAPVCSRGGWPTWWSRSAASSGSGPRFCLR
jgi:hypothetical protein